VEAIDTVYSIQVWSRLALSEEKGNKYSQVLAKTLHGMCGTLRISLEMQLLVANAYPRYLSHPARDASNKWTVASL